MYGFAKSKWVFVGVILGNAYPGGGYRCCDWGGWSGWYWCWCWCWLCGYGAGMSLNALTEGDTWGDEYFDGKLAKLGDNDSDFCGCNMTKCEPWVSPCLICDILSGIGLASVIEFCPVAGVNTFTSFLMSLLIIIGTGFFEYVGRISEKPSCFWRNLFLRGGGNMDFRTLGEMESGGVFSGFVTLSPKVWIDGVIGA